MLYHDIQGVEGATAATQAWSLPAEADGNDWWAMKAYNHADIYFNLISSVDPSNLKLTKVDDRIYTSFKESFSDLNIKNLDPDMLKTAEAKEKWPPFCNQFDGVVEDFNYGTLLQLDQGYILYILQQKTFKNQDLPVFLQ
uniref:Polysaccharide biosynthesis domain containing 1 n=1 Tax=Hucho hucho TaxID=62062 RepID=A0A4W5QN59_9TELE